MVQDHITLMVQSWTIRQGQNPGGGGGVLRFGLDGDVPLEPRNPYPCSGVILAEKNTHV